MSHKYKTIDLCAGIGGIRRGFEMTGRFENILSAEIDDAACATYEHLYGENPKNDLTSEEFMQKAIEAKYDVLLAGFPCQTFSRAGLQLGFQDATKGTIFFSIANIISRSQPKAVFLENVENLISHDNRKTIKTIVKTLEDELGYRIIGVTQDDNGAYVYSRKTFIRNSKDFGLPQNRPRAYIMAFNKKEYGEAIKVLSDELPLKGSKIIAKDVTSILDEHVDDNYYIASQYLKTLKKHKERERSKGNGFGYAVVNDPKIDHPIANTILATGGSGKERNLVYQPKAGVAGKVIPRKRSPINDEGIRFMTPLEWGKLQGFVGYAFVDQDGIDHFCFPEGTSKTQQYKQFGNSVTIPVIQEMAVFMLQCFDKMNACHEEIVRKIATDNKTFNKQDVIRELNISINQANYLLRKMVRSGEIELVNRGRHSKYCLRSFNNEQ